MFLIYTYTCIYIYIYMYMYIYIYIYIFGVCMCVCVCVCMCVCVFVSVYVWVCLCIYILSSTDCFIVSQLFSVARPARCFRLGLKPGWHYVCRISYPKAIVLFSVTEGIFTYIFIYIYTYQFMRTALHLRIYGSRQFSTLSAQHT